MIKVIKGKIINGYTEEMLGDKKLPKKGVYMNNEEVLYYTSNKGNIVASAPRNRRNESISVNLSEAMPNEDFFGTKSFLTSEVLYFRDKKSLTKAIKDFNYEKGM